MAERPKLLYLAYCFPPLNVIGSVRAWNTAVYLTRRGWDVTVVTPEPSLWRQVEQAEWVDAEIARRGFRRILTGHRWQLLGDENLRNRNRWVGRFAGGVCRQVAYRLGISPAAGWGGAVNRACTTLAPADVELILATGSPFNAFEMARRLSQRLGCPYVLDYRDPWTIGDPLGLMHPPAKRSIREEQRVLSESAAVVIVSHSWAAALDRDFGVGGKVHVITNGYDPEECQRVVPRSFDHFAIVYTGNLYPPVIVLSPVMAALRRVLTECSEGLPPWRFHYFGSHADQVRETAKQHLLADRLTVHGTVPRSQALAATKGASLAVVIATVSPVGTPGERGIVPAKTFEVLGLGTPLLAVGPPSSDIDMLLTTAGQGRRFAGDDIDGMSAFLRDVMRGSAPEAKNPEVYSWPRLAEKLDAVLRGVLHG